MIMEPEVQIPFSLHFLGALLDLGWGFGLGLDNSRPIGTKMRKFISLLLLLTVSSSSISTLYKIITMTN